MISKTFGAAIFGVDAQIITVEVGIEQGIGYHLAGLPDNAIKESYYRISSALKAVNHKIPGKKIVINMAPADLRKEGAAYDLTLAVGILLASNQINTNLDKKYLIMGELSLDGSLRPIKGILPIAISAQKNDFKSIIIPKENAKEASIVKGLTVFPASDIGSVIDHLNGKQSLKPLKTNDSDLLLSESSTFLYDFSDIKGQENVKRALEIAAAGGHNALLIGPPGSGKTMIAKRIPSILPPLSLKEALETTKIHSVMGLIGSNSGIMAERPYRAPHHTSSDVALVGGGAYPMPGEISLAHNGVLFLDELPEFKRSVLEVLRQPLEDRMVTISRARFTLTYPASFMLIAAMNPSPSGFFSDDPKNTSSIMEMQRYMGKISGPLLDRIDLHIEVNPVAFDVLTEKRQGESSQSIRKRVVAARQLQGERFKSHPHISYNAQMGPKELDDYCVLDQSSKTILSEAVKKLGLSARAYDRILRVSRTIADLQGASQINSMHIAQAVQYRSLDRETR